MIASIHVSNGRKVVAICDDDILGKKFEEGDAQLDLSGSFFKGAPATREVIKKMIVDAYMIQFAGGESVDFALGEGLVREEQVQEISGVPHAMVIFLQ